jgi:hypothetical protein
MIKYIALRYYRKCIKESLKESEKEIYPCDNADRKAIILEELAEKATFSIKIFEKDLSEIYDSRKVYSALEKASKRGCQVEIMYFNMETEHPLISPYFSQKNIARIINGNYEGYEDFFVVDNKHFYLKNIASLFDKENAMELVKLFEYIERRGILLEKAFIERFNSIPRL